ncbi:hypothetical protein FHS91_002496 [Sphingobium xanthum]|uniref:hypothetical protein n=1 Tax=Sphingobium xanthum TaxID=1387165 RepID=UPI001C8C9843|nr:hypothetical protein [Sphingobium xanthum]
MTRLVFLDQNAWIVLAQGAWDKSRYPREHAALTMIVEGVKSGLITVPLTFSNIYETSKINVPDRRANLAMTQSLISGGRIFRSRRAILAETLLAYIAEKSSIARALPEEGWFLSDLWFESAADYSPDVYSVELSPAVLNFIRNDPARALFDYLLFPDESVRVEAVRRYSVGSAELITRLENRRAIAVGETLAMRKRIYGARLTLDELDFILAAGRRLGLDWKTVNDIGSSLMRGIVADVPVLHVERELVVRLEDQSRGISENDLRDMLSFTTVLPFADVMVAEKQFVNLARQARLGETFKTKLITSIFEFDPSA